MKGSNRNNEGFSFAELLAAILIMLMATSIVTAGIPSAINAFENVVVGSNAQVLLSSTINALRNELCTAINIEYNSSGSNRTYLSYYDSNLDAKSLIHLDEATGVPKAIMIKRYCDLPNPIDELLISSPAATDKLYASYSNIEVHSNEGYVVFKNLAVYRRSDLGRAKALAKIDNSGDLVIRYISGLSVEDPSA